MSLLVRNFTRTPVNQRRLTAAEEAVRRVEKQEKETEISLVFVGKKRIRDLNRQYRGVDRVTDVLSFEEDGHGKDRFVDPEDDVSHLGEIFICVERAREQAEEKRHSLAREIDILLVHGLFHLLGYDHIKDKDYEVMHAREEEALSYLN